MPRVLFETQLFVHTFRKRKSKHCDLDSAVAKIRFLLLVEDHLLNGDSRFLFFIISNCCYSDVIFKKYDFPPKLF